MKNAIIYFIKYIPEISGVIMTALIAHLWIGDELHKRDKRKEEEQEEKRKEEEE